MFAAKNTVPQLYFQELQLLHFKSLRFTLHFVFTLKTVAFNENKVMLCFPTTEIPGGIPEWAVGERVLQERPQHGTLVQKRHEYKWWFAPQLHDFVYFQLEFLSVGALSFVTDLGPKGL